MKAEFGHVEVERNSIARPVRIVMALLAASVLLLAVAGPAYAERDFSPRFSENVQGDIAIAANTVMTCPDSDPACSAAQTGTGSKLNNNQFNMRFVDVDGDPSTFNSSTAELVLPSGFEVLFAGLYYGGRTSAGAGGTQAPNTAARGTVKLKVPGGTTYQSLTAAVDDSAEVSRAYGAFVDVTSIVQAAGVGDYTVADVQAGTGEDRYGGWSLVVAYRDSDAPARNLTIFDGLQNVTKAKPALTIGVTGFQTPATGPVKTNLGFVSFEGDRGIGGDNATLNGQVLSTATNPPNNFFNSSISKDGVPVNTKEPNYDNQMGYDSILTKADGYLANGASSAAIRLQTSNETYLPQVITFATELFSPRIGATKSVENVTDPGQRPEGGDTLRYTVTYTNSGGDGAGQFTASDLIPAGTTYAPGTLAITAGPNAPATPTDAIGDDLAEFLPAPNTVRFRLGQGANNVAGGLLTAAGGPATSTTIAFDVTVDSGLTSGTPIANSATASFLSQTLGTEQSVESNEVVLDVQAPDLVMSKSHADPPPGGPVVFTLGVVNDGSAPTAGSVTVSDSFPSAAFSSISIDSSTGWDCSATVGLDLSCTRSDALPAGSAFPPIVVEAALVGSPPALFSNTAEVAGGGDPNPVNNVAIDYLPAPPATSDLAVTKSVGQSSVITGSRAIWTITARNNGPSPATGVVVSDELPTGADSDVSFTTDKGSCEVTATPAVVCTIGGLEAGESATVTISATVTATDTVITNGVSIEGDQIDTRPNNNEATASFEAAGTADLSIVKTAGADPIAGESFSYTLSITNDGPLEVFDPTVTDQIPALFTPTGWSTTGFFDCDDLPPAGGTMECVPTGPIGVGETVTITLTGDLAPASAGVPFANTAGVYSSLADPTPENNSSSVSITPLPFADLSMSKTADADAVKVGQAVTWTFGVRNLGPLDADPVTLEDELPAGLTIVSLPEECDLSGTTLTCNLGALDPDDSRTFALTVRPGPAFAGETITNSAQVSSPRPDPNSANQNDTASFEVAGDRTRLTLKQKVNRKKARSGGKFSFGLTVENTSNASAYDSVVCQKLPRALKIVRAKGAKIGPGRKACWTIGRLDPGESRKFSILTRGFSKRSTSATAPVTLTGENVEDGRKSKTVRIVVAKKPKPVPPRPVAG